VRIVNDPNWDADTARLQDQKRRETGYGFCDYEMRAVESAGGFIEHAIDALGFEVEHFNMQDSQAVSCCRCGGLFKEELQYMRKHRLACGWL
jgi:hypothetical protein